MVYGMLMTFFPALEYRTLFTLCFRTWNGYGVKRPSLSHSGPLGPSHFCYCLCHCRDGLSCEYIKICVRTEQKSSTEEMCACLCVQELDLYQYARAYTSIKATTQRPSHIWFTCHYLYLISLTAYTPSHTLRETDRESGGDREGVRYWDRERLRCDNII